MPRGAKQARLEGNDGEGSPWKLLPNFKVYYGQGFHESFYINKADQEGTTEGSIVWSWSTFRALLSVLTGNRLKSLVKLRYDARQPIALTSHICSVVPGRPEAGACCQRLM